MPATTPRLLARAAAALAVLALPLASAGAAHAGDSHAPIQGSGSSWSANAVNQWIADVQSNQGLQVVFTSSGSAQGRKDFASYATDFAVSDIGFRGTDSRTGEKDTSDRAFAYLPIVAGGTSFPYQLRVNGKQVRDLRLSGLTLAKIFTNQITNWNDPAITHDNNGRQLPSIPILPVVHSEGSGSTAQFTTYLDDQFPTIWEPFFGQSGFTEYFPRKGNAIAQNGSDGVMNFVTSAAANGAIAYDEYSYALGKDYPVVKLLNKAGYFTLPTQYNVAVALQDAQIDTNPSSPTYLLQKLHGVYVNPRPQTYPMSSYSYAIIPISPKGDPKLNTAKRQTLVDYLDYSVCAGQAEMGPIGYSSLPVNLVSASFNQVAKLRDADPGVTLGNNDVHKCNNPTFDAAHPSRNKLAELAPTPLACDKDGAGPCGDAVVTPGTQGTSAGRARGGAARAGTGTTQAGSRGVATGLPGRAGGVGGSSVRGSAAAAPGSVPGAAATGTGASLPGGAGPVDAATGQAAGATGEATSGGQVTAVPVTLERSAGSSGLLGLVALLLVLAILATPPLLARRPAPVVRRSPAAPAPSAEERA